MNQNEFYKQLIHRYVTNQATESELEAFFALLESDKLDSELYEYLMSEAAKEDEERQLKKRRVSWTRIAAAASILLCCGLGYFFLRTHKSQQSSTIAASIKPGFNKAILTLANGRKINLNDASNGELAQEAGIKITKDKNGQITYVVEQTGTEVKYNTTTTPKGGQWHLVLQDGTEVWLNAMSSLRYPTSFTGSERQVELNGEGYFEVAKDKSHPFIVKTNNAAIRVLGTHFNINTYDGEDMKATLLEGSIQASNNSSSMLLKPGQQAVAKSNASEIQVKDVNANESVAWKNGFFVFHNDNIVTIMNQLIRWYDIDVVYHGDVAQKRFDGDYSNSKDISELLNALEQTKTIHFKMEGRRVTVMP